MDDLNFRSLDLLLQIASYSVVAAIAVFSLAIGVGVGVLIGRRRS